MDVINEIMTEAIRVWPDVTVVRVRSDSKYYFCVDGKIRDETKYLLTHNGRWQPHNFEWDAPTPELLLAKLKELPDAK